MLYRSPTLDEAGYQLEKFSEKWKAAYPMVVKSWQQYWVRTIPVFLFAPEIRRAIYPTNTIESIKYDFAKIIKNRAMFPSDEAVFKILYLALKNHLEKMDNADLIFGKTVTVKYSKIDKCGRCGGTIFIKSKEVNLEQNNAGLAWHYKNYANEQKEKHARAGFKRNGKTEKVE